MKLLDAAGSIFFQNELEQIKARAYDVLYPELSYDKAFDVSTEINPGAAEIVYQTFDRRGRAKIVVGPANDIPRVDVEGKETRIPVRPLVASFGYTIDEIEAARFVGRPLEQKRANACRLAIEEQMNEIAWKGDTQSGLKGFFTSSIPTSAAPNGGGGTPQWSTKTAAEILADVNYAFTRVFEDSKGVERANRMGVPLAQWNLIMTTQYAANSDLTIAQWIVMQSPWLSSLDQIMAINELDSTFTGATDYLIVWTKNPEKLQVEMPMDVTFMEPQLDGLEYVTIARAKTGGMNVYYPGSAYILSAI